MQYSIVENIRDQETWVGPLKQSSGILWLLEFRLVYYKMQILILFQFQDYRIPQVPFITSSSHCLLTFEINWTVHLKVSLSISEMC